MRIAVNACHLGDDRHGLSRFTAAMLDALHRHGRRDSIRLLLPPQAVATAARRYPRFQTASGPALPARRFSSELLRHFRLSDCDLLWAPANVAPRDAGTCPLLITLHDAIPALPFSRKICSRPSLLSLAAFGDWQKLRVDCRQARHAALVATDSEHARDTLLPLLRLPADRVPVHLMPLDPHFRPIPAGARQRGLAALGIQSPYLLFIGGTRRRKNLARLLAAWAILSPAARRGRRLLAAAVPDARLCALGRRAGDVVWLGHVDDAVLPLLYGGADFLAYPSLAEGFGLPPLEAAACGTPSLVSDNGALVETAAGFSLAVDPFSTQALADGIRRLLSDHRLCDRLRAAGGAVRARHSPCRVARALENLFQAAVERTTADRRWDRRIDFS